MPEDRVLEEPQTGDEGAIQSQQQPAVPTQPPTVEEEESVPPCPEGQVLDEESRLCVLEESEVAEEPEEQPAEEEQQPSDEVDGSEENSNNN